VNRRLAARLGRLEEAFLPESGDGPLCVHHGSACGLGTQELPELYKLIVEAKQRQGMAAPPLDEHRLATTAEAARYRREVAGSLAEARARVAAEEAEIRGERP
jgi:hypothetical protein